MKQIFVMIGLAVCIWITGSISCSSNNGEPPGADGNNVLADSIYETDSGNDVCTEANNDGFNESIENPCSQVVPGNGSESEPCFLSEHCDGKMYCNLTRCVCYPPRECAQPSDCSNPGNEWEHDACVGKAECDNGLCTWICD